MDLSPNEITRELHVVYLDEEPAERSNIPQNIPQPLSMAVYIVHDDESGVATFDRTT